MVHQNDHSTYYLNSPKKDEKGRPVFFGAVAIKKNYVSFHLMPVYIFPGLLNGLSPELKKRMQGKSCFNFKQVEPRLFTELQQLTENGYQKYKEEKLM